MAETLATVRRLLAPFEPDDADALNAQWSASGMPFRKEMTLDGRRARDHRLTSSDRTSR